jgi:hypothetical protein
LYFWFGEPIRTRRWDGLADDKKAQRAVRDEVKAAVTGGIQFLLAERERDPGASLRTRVLGRAICELQLTARAVRRRRPGTP